MVRDDEIEPDRRAPEGRVLALRGVQLPRDAGTDTVRDPARLGWKPIVTVEHYVVQAEAVRGAGRSSCEKASE
jgi:hypothetical protein